MLRFKIKRLLEKKEFYENQRFTINELTDSTAINRMTLSRIIIHQCFSTVTDNLDKLCAYFQCKIGDLVEYVSEDLLKDIQNPNANDYGLLVTEGECQY